jgi:hypothetical protein
MPFCGPCFVHDLTPFFPMSEPHSLTCQIGNTRLYSSLSRLLGQQSSTTSEHVNIKTKCGPRLSSKFAALRITAERALRRLPCALCASSVQPWSRPAARDGPG